MVTLNDIITLYTHCFPEDSPATIELFFAHKLGLDNCHYLEENNKLACQLFIVNKKLSYLKNDIELPYIVGLGTDKDNRNKGLASVLMKQVLEKITSPFIALYPFSHEFYEKMGFATVSYDYDCTKKTVPIDVDTCKELYHKYNQDKDFFIVRDDIDFTLITKIMALDKVNFSRTEPNGYTNGEETVILGKEGNLPGTMVRIANLEYALSLSKITLPPIKIVDKFIAKNNITISVDNGKMIPCKEYKWEVEILTLCLILFGKGKKLPFTVPKYKGHLLDRY